MPDFCDHFIPLIGDLFPPGVLANSYSRLATAKAHFRRDELPNILVKFRKIADNPHRLTRRYIDP